eukprot:CAMPEP_0176379992 /NCGR_PEP_ID=MMETSP0126-20121128/30783_1 /TAXON_ID=141414 ORGANISM="Strombidinopsis acuminatum, Strain SPMC142" /NCGR_SAMPLE_ID=MMETSP0126 /ASSEMBLY_ACC=CAM_ASM_000229 /LENGTH=47 /DNA_ID= /DNA_START= /DNA_END= /DNA_ORIENTATION=
MAKSFNEETTPLEQGQLFYRKSKPTDPYIHENYDAFLAKLKDKIGEN